MSEDSTSQDSYSIAEAFELFVLDMQARRLSELTIKFYRAKLKAFFAHCEANQIDMVGNVNATLIKKYQVTLHHYSPHYQHGIARAIRAFLKYCESDELIDSCPKFSMPKLPKHVPIIFTNDEVKQVLNGCKSYRDHAICLMLLDTGVRTAELIALNYEDINLKDGSVNVLNGKGGKDRVVYMGAKTRKQLKLYMMREKHSQKRGDPLFITLKGNRFKIQIFMNLMQRIKKRAGVESCRAHTFRRTFAVNCLRNEMNIYVLAKLMGHEDITVLKSYLDFVADDLEAAHERAGPVDHMTIK